MRILLTNDDGVYAPGLAALHAALAAAGHQLTVVAPETEQSAVGHAITLADPIRVRPLGPRTGFTGWAVAGTPADCVKLAVNQLMPAKPEIICSGINLGANVGVNLLYSGTVSAASEAAILGFTALAFSLDSHQRDADFSAAARVAAHVAALRPGLPLEPGVPVNVNVPALPAAELKGLKVCAQSQARLVERFIERQDPRGHTYYWQAGETMGLDNGLTSDHTALGAGYVTLTPIRLDLTHRRSLEALDAAGLDLPEGLGGVLAAERMGHTGLRQDK